MEWLSGYCNPATVRFRVVFPGGCDLSCQMGVNSGAFSYRVTLYAYVFVIPNQYLDLRVVLAHDLVERSRTHTGREGLVDQDVAFLEAGQSRAHWATIIRHESRWVTTSARGER